MDYEPQTGSLASEDLHQERATDAIKKWRDGAWTRNRGTLLLLALGSAILTIRGIQVHEGALHALLNASQHKSNVPATVNVPPQPSDYFTLSPSHQEITTNVPVEGVITPDQAKTDAHGLTKGASEITAGIFGMASSAVTGAILGVREFLGKRKPQAALA